jgi:hypothetical protein
MAEVPMTLVPPLLAQALGARYRLDGHIGQGTT